MMSALADMNADSLIKQKRIDYLWGRVRSHVNQQRFLSRISVSTHKSSEKILKGITDRKQVYFHKESTVSKDEQKLKCLINYNTRFKIFWEIVMAIIFILCFWLVPINLATSMRYYDEFGGLELFIDIILVFDIVMNFIS